MDKLICIDIGNSNIELGITNIDEGFDFLNFRMVTNHHITVDEVSLILFNILSYFGVKRSEVNGVCISSVVPEIDIQFKNGVRNLFGFEPVFVNSFNVPIEIDYKNLYEIGSDRLVTAFSALEIYSRDSFIVDIGTATTIDIVTDGVYEGGIIMPGIIISLDALFEKASKISKVSLEIPDSFIGKTTQECIRIGVLGGTAKAIEGLIEEIIRIKNRDFKIILTGGLIDKVIPLIKKLEFIVDKKLVLKGLKILYKKLFC